MRKYIPVILFVLLSSSTINSLATPSPVLLFLSRQDQIDTLGYNIVGELPVLVYKEIMTGRVPLWDSPNKEVQIKPASLKRLEESTGDAFIHAQQLFIYELWDLDKRKGDLKTLGFYFSSRTRKGEEVSYGFVEYAPLDSLFRASRIPSNSNGNCELTFYDILSSKYYFYNVVQVGEKKITNIKEAIVFKEEVTQFVNQRTVPPGHDIKEIIYRIDAETDVTKEGFLKANQFMKSLQLYLNENPEVFYNIGGERIRSFIQPQKISISSVEIREKWRKIGDRIDTELLSVQVFIGDESLDLLSATNIHILDLLIDFKSPSDFINEKEFYFRITRINNQDISNVLSAAYLKGLRSWKWNQLTEFVRYE